MVRPSVGSSAGSSGRSSSAPSGPSFVRNKALRRYYYVAAESRSLDTGPVGARVLDTPLVLWRGPDGDVVAARDRCPHRQAPLSLGSVHDGQLQCRYHGWRFGAEGRCVAVPSDAEGVEPPSAADVGTFAVVERYGLVWVCIGNPTCEPPVIAQEADATFRRINTGVDVWEASATRMTDNFLDISHFPFVHLGTFGRAQDTLVPEITVEQLDESFHGYQYEVDVNNPDAATATTGTTEDVLHRHMSTGFHLPFAVRSTIRYETGLEHIILLLSTPIDDVTSYFTFVIWRNDDFSVSAEEVIAFDRAIGAEDKAMLEQVPGVLSLTESGVVSVQADKASLAWRRQLISLLG